MKVGAYSTLIVAVILGVVLTTSLMVPVIAQTDGGATEEKLVPTDVTNGELFNAVDNAPDGRYTDEIDYGNVLGRFRLSIFNGFYVTSSFNEQSYSITGRMWDEGSYYLYELRADNGTSNPYTASGAIDKATASLYNISDRSCFLQYDLYVSNGTVFAQIYFGQGNKDDLPTTHIQALIPQGVVAYYGIPDLTTNGYVANQVMLSQGLTTSATTQAYYITGFTPTNAQVVDVITHNNTLVGYLNNDESQPVYKFNANNDIDMFAPIDNTFLGVERVGYSDYYNIKDVTIYEKKDVPVDSPIKWVLAIIPVMVLVGIVVFVINTQIVQKRD